jgi:hypothetical protein
MSIADAGDLAADGPVLDIRSDFFAHRGILKEISTCLAAPRPLSALTQFGGLFA